MASPLLAGFEARLKTLDQYLIVRRADYNDYTPEDFTKAIAYRLLASAALEDFIEKRCLEIAAQGCERLAKSQPTSTGRALIVWASVGDRQMLPVPIHEVDAISDLSATEGALKSYTKLVRRSHGIDGTDLKHLVLPLGIRASQVPEVLINSLDALAQKRNPASHTYVKSQAEPVSEVTTLEQILIPLRQLDADLATVLTSFPSSHL